MSFLRCFRGSRMVLMLMRWALMIAATTNVIVSAKIIHGKPGRGRPAIAKISWVNAPSGMNSKSEPSQMDERKYALRENGFGDFFSRKVESGKSRVSEIVRMLRSEERRVGK